MRPERKRWGLVDIYDEKVRPITVPNSKPLTKKEKELAKKLLPEIIKLLTV